MKSGAHRLPCRLGRGGLTGLRDLPVFQLPPSLLATVLCLALAPANEGPQPCSLYTAKTVKATGRQAILRLRQSSPLRGLAFCGFVQCSPFTHSCSPWIKSLSKKRRRPSLSLHTVRTVCAKSSAVKVSAVSNQRRFTNIGVGSCQETTVRPASGRPAQHEGAPGPGNRPPHSGCLWWTTLAPRPWAPATGERQD